jgi:hypothetical protein
MCATEQRINTIHDLRAKDAEALRWFIVSRPNMRRPRQLSEMKQKLAKPGCFFAKSCRNASNSVKYRKMWLKATGKRA